VAEADPDADKQPTQPTRDAPLSDDDARAKAAAENRKRALAEWEANKKSWRSMGVPPALPAAGSTPKK
jgi:hypothetical protein